ncbi:MAG: CBS domain-containing protein [Candidatus Lokiarchaeota archaeon]|nr:CBS domain-containing protein [Candidatus Lokiarchaeota archaeon]
MREENKTIQQFGLLKISEIMVKDPLYITPNEKISATELLMVRKNIGGLPVVESNKNKKLIGIITQRDIRLARFAMSLDKPNTLVSDLMTSEPYIIKESDTLIDTLKKMFDNNVERIPVVNDKNELIGLVLEKTVLEKLMKYLISDCE